MVITIYTIDAVILRLVLHLTLKTQTFYKIKCPVIRFHQYVGIHNQMCHITFALEIFYSTKNESQASIIIIQIV